MNAFFDRYVDSKTSLTQFTEQYENILKSKWEKKIKAYSSSLTHDWLV